MVILVGLVVGSFLNVCISRIPKEASIAFPPSHCPKCNTTLKVIDLIPIFSWIMLKGKCRYCSQPVSAIYPIVEFLSAAVFLTTYIKFGFSINFLFYTVMFLLLMVISFIDIETLEIPDFLVIAGIFIALIYAVINRTLPESLFAMAAGFSFMFLLSEGATYFLKKEALGEGDIKLIIMFGAMLGVERMFMAIFVSSLIGSVVAGMSMLLRKMNKNDQIPFGPFLSLGAFISILF